jgi:hypothetical protein
MRRNITTRFVVVISAVLLLACVGWALLVQQIVPDACSYHPPPARAQVLHCP